jgi:Protein of unknown function (DUF3300)
MAALPPGGYRAALRRQKEDHVMCRRILAVVLSVTMALGTVGWSTVDLSAQAAAPKATTPDQQGMDKLLAPIALYPDALLAQVLACAGSPQQVTDVTKWIKENSQLKGADLQQAAEAAGFDASFVAIVLFPDVLTLLGQNMEWTTELGKAFSSNQKAVLDSVQRLRAQAMAVGNLKTTAQQEVKTDTQNGQTVIVVQPANPQIVYVPVYNPQTVYVAAPPPPPSNSGNVAAAAAIGFMAGIALGAAMSNSYGYYGWGAWGMHWHSSVIVVHGGVWRVPPRGRYVYVRPVAGYHPNYHVNAPRYNNVNVNINHNTINNVNRTNTPARTARPTPYSAGSTRAGQNTAGQGRAQPAAPASPAGQLQRGSRTSAFGGYQKGSSEKAASSRGRASAESKPNRKK